MGLLDALWEHWLGPPREDADAILQRLERQTVQRNPPEPPPFLAEPQEPDMQRRKPKPGLIWRSSACKQFDERVFADAKAGREYWYCRSRGTWHEIKPQERRFRDVDPTTGQPVMGREGKWRPLL